MNSSFLWDLLSQPTAPFQESLVIRRVQAELNAARVPYFQDPAGNLVLGASSKKDLFQKLKPSIKEPLRVFVAHMDHPGFHGVKWITPEKLKIQWHGGSPIEHLEGASVWIGDHQGFSNLHGKLTQVKMMEKGRPAIEQAEVVFQNAEPSLHYPDAQQIFGGFKFRAPIWEEQGRLYTKAADDLIGVFAIAQQAIELWGSTKKKKERAQFLGLLTRAEEVGFIGAIDHFKLGWLTGSRRPILVVSLETSRALPGAEFGKGPIVRLGDRATVFDAGALQILTDLAQKHLPGKHQRRIMDGGSCEATAATAFGLRSIGISIPLGNYHNQCFEGGPDSTGPNGPAPEFVELSDIQGMQVLCQALLTSGLPWQDPWKTKKKDLLALSKKYKSLMKIS